MTAVWIAGRGVWEWVCVCASEYKINKWHLNVWIYINGSVVYLRQCFQSFLGVFIEIHWLNGAHWVFRAWSWCLDLSSVRGPAWETHSVCCFKSSETGSCGCIRYLTSCAQTPVLFQASVDIHNDSVRCLRRADITPGAFTVTHTLTEQMTVTPVCVCLCVCVFCKCIFLYGMCSDCQTQ